MMASLPQRRLALAMAASVAGVAACLATGTPFGLLVPVAGLFLHVRGRAVPLLIAALSVAFAASALAASILAGGMRGDAVSWAAFFALAACIGAVISAHASAAAPRHGSGREADVAGAALDDGAATDAPASLEPIHPDDRPAAAQAAARAFWTGVPQVVRLRHRQPDGSYRWTATRSEPVYGASVQVDDLETEKEQLTKAAPSLPGDDGAAAVRAAKVIESLFGNAWAFDAAGRWTYLPTFAQTTLGMTPADLNASLAEGHSSWERLLHPDDRERFTADWRRCLHTGDQFNAEHRIRRATGIHAWARSAARPSRDGQNRITGWYGTSIDVDVYRRTVAALRESEISLRQLVETVPALIWCTAPDGEPVYTSRQLREFFGFDVQEINTAGASRLSRVLAAAIHPDDLDTVSKLFAHSLATGEPYALRHRMLRFDGEYRWVETRAMAMRNDGGAIVQWNGVCLDIEDQVRAQDELRRARENLARASQAASLAELSASIAHEVNQPLAAVVANSHACQRWLRAEPPNLDRALGTVERIIRDANSAADVVGRIRALFKQSTEARVRTTLGSVVAETRDLMAEEAARRSVRLDVQIGSDDPPVALDRVQIQQVLVNLMRNGMEAMDSVGDGRILQVRSRRTGDAVRTEVSDRGPGVGCPDRIFEPFFTTKQRGMGMGLAICRTIVEAHGGRLWAEGNEPHGATFAFTLPLQAGTAP